EDVLDHGESSGSQTPVWEPMSSKLCFVSKRAHGQRRNGVSQTSVPKQEFGNEGLFDWRLAFARHPAHAKPQAASKIDPLNPIVLTVRHMHAATAVHRQRPRTAQLPRRTAVTAPDAERFAL